jgi:D-amino-acid dehydrogenase
VVDQRVGLRPATTDGEPVLGPIPGWNGLWAATGMGPQGLTLGPYSAKLVADALLGCAPVLDLAPFAPLRATTPAGGAGALT